MKKLYSLAKRLVPILTVVLLIVQIPDAGLSLWERSSSFSLEGLLEK